MLYNWDYLYLMRIISLFRSTPIDKISSMYLLFLRRHHKTLIPKIYSILCLLSERHHCVTHRQSRLCPDSNFHGLYPFQQISPKNRESTNLKIKGHSSPLLISPKMLSGDGFKKVFITPVFINSTKFELFDLGANLSLLYYERKYEILRQSVHGMCTFVEGQPNSSGDSIKLLFRESVMNII